MYSGTRRRFSSIVISVIMIAAMMFGVIAFQTGTADASTKGKLVSKVTVYSKSGSKWKHWYTDKYYYNKKKDPVRIYYGDHKKSERMTYEYKNGKKVSMQQKGLYGSDFKATYDSKGRRITQESEYYKIKIYYNKKGLISKVVQPATDYTSKETTKFHYSYFKNGNPVTLYVNGDSGIGSNSQFSKKGYVIGSNSYNVADGAPRYEYHFNKYGRVSYVISEIRDNGKIYRTKYVFSYKNKSIPLKRYKTMINSILVGDCTGCGSYWY
jgi:hypothetical protein